MKLRQFSLLLLAVCVLLGFEVRAQATYQASYETVPGTIYWPLLEVTCSYQERGMLTLTIPESGSGTATLQTTPVIGSACPQANPYTFALELTINRNVSPATFQGVSGGIQVSGIVGIGFGFVNLTFACVGPLPAAQCSTSGSVAVRQHCSLPVPLLKQTGTWGGDRLGQTQKTLASKGCAVASVAMVVSAHGISMTPREVNDQLKEYSDMNGNNRWDPGEHIFGFTESGDLKWGAIATITDFRVLPSVPFGPPPLYSGVLDRLLCLDTPVILQQPGHFVVPYEQIDSGFSIRDPGYPRTTLAAYGNNWILGRSFRGPLSKTPGAGTSSAVDGTPSANRVASGGSSSVEEPAESRRMVEVYARTSLEVLLVDSLGRRAGKSLGLLYEEIPGAVVTTEYVDDLGNEGSGINQTLQIISVRDPKPGAYSVKVRSGTSNEGTVDVDRYDTLGRPKLGIARRLRVASGGEKTLDFNYSDRLGDLDSNGRVDVRDQLLVLFAWIRSAHGKGNDRAADLTGDGVVNQKDFKTVVELMDR